MNAERYIRAAAMLLCVTACLSAQDTGKPKPNIAVSGCLMREGYGTVVVAMANVDAVGDAAGSATPGAAKPGSPEAPAKWILDHPGPAGQHVGEMVQIIGVSSWVDESQARSQAAHSDEAPSVPHIEVQSFKVLAGSCS